MTTNDLMFQDRIRTVVRDAYRSLPRGGGATTAARLYRGDDVARLPTSAVRWSLGVGDPVRHAGLRPGEHVLDLGCGGGIDTILAAEAVGPDGHVVGVDALPEMCGRARAAVVEAGVEGWCEIVEGEMEDLPLADGRFDVVISNGVINLSHRKSRALAEVARVLRPEGRLCVTDLTVDDDLPPEVLASGAAWAGCIAGAMSERLLARKLDRAGFTDVRMDERIPFSLDDCAAYPLFEDDILALMRRLLGPEAQRHIATSVLVRARLAGAGQERTAPDAAASAAVHVRPLDAVPAVDHGIDGVRVRPLKRVEDVAFKVLEIAPGRATPFHTHLHTHEGLVVDGEGALQLRDRRVPLATGDVFSVAPNEPHAIHATPADALRLVCLDCLLD